MEHQLAIGTHSVWKKKKKIASLTNNSPCSIFSIGRGLGDDQKTIFSFLRDRGMQQEGFLLVTDKTSSLFSAPTISLDRGTHIKERRIDLSEGREGKLKGESRLRGKDEKP